MGIAADEQHRASSKVVAGTFCANERCNAIQSMLEVDSARDVRLVVVESSEAYGTGPCTNYRLTGAQRSRAWTA